MTRLRIGSTAAPVIFGRPSKDVDWIAHPSEVEGLAAGWPEFYPKDGCHYVGHRDDQHIEVEVAYPGSTGEALLALVAEHGLASCGESANMDVLLALKLSHRFKRGPHFLKTLRDIQRLRAAGAQLPRCLWDWLKRRQRETLDYGHPKLDQSAKGFFTDNVPYRYVHDTIHLAMARPGMPPAYQDFQADGAEVKVDKAKWAALPESRQLDSVLEECYVLALERHQIPNDYTPDPTESFRIALQKVCTTIASGWWREWAWEHYDAAIAGMNPLYVQWCREAIASGLIQPYVKTT
jgi:hypothetical protein